MAIQSVSQCPCFLSSKMEGLNEKFCNNLSFVNYMILWSYTIFDIP